MTTPLTDGINALTAYINEVTGASDTTLSDAVESLVAGYGGKAEVKTGTFTGDKTTFTANLNVGFEPDIVIVECDLNYTAPGWAGMGNIVIVKNVLTTHLRHNNTALASANSTSNLCEESHPYGMTTGSSATYGIYSDGVFTITNTSNSAGTRFVEDVTYKWTAVKFS